MRGLIVVGVSLLCYGAGALAEEPACVEPKAKVQLSFRDASVVEVAEFFSQATCKQFIVSAKVKNERVTLLSAKPLSTEDAFQAFEAALDTAGIAVLPEGKFLKLDLNSAQSAASSVSVASSIELSFIEGKSTTTYKLPAPGDNRPTRLELSTPEQNLSIELAWSKEKGALQYEVQRQFFGKTDKASLSLSGTIVAPASGKVSLLDSSSLGLYMTLTP